MSSILFSFNHLFINLSLFDGFAQILHHKQFIFFILESIVIKL